MQRSNSKVASPKHVIESEMTYLLAGFTRTGSSKDGNSVDDVTRLLWWHQKRQICIWISILVASFIILNICLLYSIFVPTNWIEVINSRLYPVNSSSISLPDSNSTVISEFSNSSSNSNETGTTHLHSAEYSNSNSNSNSNLNSNSMEGTGEYKKKQSAMSPMNTGLSNLNSTQTIQKSPGYCDLTIGEWVYDPEPPLYTNETCKYIQLLQNCMANGKPNNGYLNWRWKPLDCELPRFDPRLFLHLLRGKRLLFFGDSLARNHMQSLLCSLTQVEEPDKVYTREDKDVRWSFPSYNFTLSIFWSPFLVKHVKLRDNPLLFNLHLDTPHPAWYTTLAEYDYAVFSASQWFFRPSLYSINNNIIGCNEYSKENYTDMYFMDAFQIALQTTVNSIAKLPGYKGTTFLRTASAEHFEHGSWSTGGTCNRTGPYRNITTELPWLPQTFNKIQMEEHAKFASENGSKLKALNVTYSAYLRPDGHPGPYRVFQPFSSDTNTGQPVRNDCLHWCLPGPVDMWNQLLLEMLREE